jgi:hypothetical protein
MGYLLNSVQYGFSYLTIGLNIVCAILLIIELLKEGNTKIGYVTIALAFANFGLFFSYYLFVPVIYLMELIWIIVEIKKNKQKIFSIKNVMFIFITLILPALYGIFYFVIKAFLQTSDAPFTHANTAGGIYTNYATNILIFMPIAIWYVIKNIKKNDIYIYGLILTIAFAVGMFALMKCGIVSEYYFMKVFYLAWIFVWIINVKGVLQNKKLIWYVLTVVAVIAINLCFIKNDKLDSLIDIYKESVSNFQSGTLVTEEQKSIVKYYRDNLEQSFDDIAVYSNAETTGEDVWLYSLFRNYYFLIKLIFGINFDTAEDWMQNGEKTYCIIIDNNVQEYLDYNSENYNVCFSNEAGAVLEKKK